MSITLECSCGKTLQIDELHRGKKAKCPACGNVLLVEGPAETAVQAAQPKPRPAAESAMPAAAKRSMMPWLVAGGCGVLALLTCVISGSGVGVWYFFIRSSDPDLAFVHADVAGFISIRFGDVMKSPAIKEQIAQLNPEQRKLLDKKTADMKDKFGVTLEDLERVTIVIRSFQVQHGPREHGPDMAIVFRSSKPLDRKKILAFLAADKNEKKHEGMSYFLVDEGQDNKSALCFVSDRILLVTPTEASLMDFLKQSAKPATHPAVANGVKLASSGKHQVVAAFKWNLGVMDQVFGHRAADGGELAGLRDMTGVAVAGTLDKQFVLEAACTFASSDIAIRARNDLDRFRRDAIQNFQGNRPDGPDRMFLRLFESATLEQRGADVVVKARVEPDLRPFADEFLRNLDFRSPKQTQSVNNLKQIGLAMHAFHDVMKQIPGHAIRHPQSGQPLLSWRVTILPYVEEAKLYNAIRHDEPWDSPHNRQFWNKMPKVFQVPGKPNDGKTYYQVFHGDESAFPKRIGIGGNPMGSGITFAGGITDGTSNTIFVVEAAEPVNWMKPDDIPYQKNQPGLINRVGNHWGDGAFHALMGDGSVRRIRRTLTPQTLDALVTRNGGEVIDDRDWEP